MSTLADAVAKLETELEHEKQKAMFYERKNAQLVAALHTERQQNERITNRLERHIAARVRTDAFVTGILANGRDAAAAVKAADDDITPGTILQMHDSLVDRIKQIHNGDAA